MHRPGCTRTADTFDPDCPRCEEMRRTQPMKPGPTPEERQARHLKQEREDHGATGCFMVVVGTVAIGVCLGALFLLVKFIKFAWTF